MTLAVLRWPICLVAVYLLLREVFLLWRLRRQMPETASRGISDPCVSHLQPVQ
jgi:hypothetical protein